MDLLQAKISFSSMLLHTKLTPKMLWYSLEFKIVFLISFRNYLQYQYHNELSLTCDTSISPFFYESVLPNFLFQLCWVGRTCVMIRLNLKQIRMGEQRPIRNTVFTNNGYKDIKYCTFSYQGAAQLCWNCAESSEVLDVEKLKMHYRCYLATIYTQVRSWLLVCAGKLSTVL